MAYRLNQMELEMWDRSRDNRTFMRVWVHGNGFDKIIDSHGVVLWRRGEEKCKNILPVVTGLLSGFSDEDPETHALAILQVLHAVSQHSASWARREGKGGHTRLYDRLCLARGFENSMVMAYREIFEGRVKE